MATNLATKLNPVDRKVGQSELSGMTENSPMNILYCDLDFEITYANPASLQTLEKISQYLPVPISKIVGSNIDIFHKDPSYQRRILANDKNLPVNTVIQLGPERLDLLVSAIYDEATGAQIGSMATWSIVTEKLAVQEKQNKLQALVENAPINIMYATVDGTIEYINPQSMETLKTIEQYLPVKIDAIEGSSYDILQEPQLSA